MQSVIKVSDIDRLLDSCECSISPDYAYRPDKGWRVQCMCGHMTEWHKERWRSTIEWNKQRRGLNFERGDDE